MSETITNTLKLLCQESENQAKIGTNFPTDIEDVQIVRIPEEAGIWDKHVPIFDQCNQSTDTVQIQNQTEYDSISITLPSTEGTSPVITNEISQANENPTGDTTHDTQTDMLAAPVHVKLQASTQPIIVHAVNDEQAIPIQNQNLNIGMNIGMHI